MERATLCLAAALFAGCASQPPPLPAVQPAPQPVPAVAAAPDPLPILASPAEQARMASYADGLYDRRYVRRTFHTQGREVDCVDFDKQPGCRNGGCPSVPPAGPSPPSPPAGSPPSPVATVDSGPVVCPNGTVPIARLDVRVMRHFHTLEEFLAGGKVAPPH